MALKIVTVVVGPLQTNCYLAVWEETCEALVVDPGADPQRILRALRDGGWTARLIVDTHGHFDHASANSALKEATGAPIAIHALDAPALTEPFAFYGFRSERPVSPPADRYLADGEDVSLGGATLHVLHTPGHTPGGIALYDAAAGIVLCGDTLFRYSVGRSDLPGGDGELLLQSIRTRLFTLPGATVAYPGHGPRTTIGEEKVGNPYVGGEA
jgi:hydroxyacylglutathione hydrolase